MSYEAPKIAWVKIYRDAQDEYRFTAYAANDRAIVVSSEGYANRGDALGAVQSLFPDARIVDRD